MPNVVRFTLSTARNLDVSGAGSFINGVLDVDANNIAHVARVRYLVQPFHAVEVGIVDSTTPPPALPAVPASPAPDPYPQYVTDADLSNPASGPSVALRAAFAPTASAGIWYVDSFTGTDDAKMAAALAAWDASPKGGVIVLSARQHTMTQPWQPARYPNWGGDQFNQKPLRITGQGHGANGTWDATGFDGATVVNFTFNGTTFAGDASAAKIDTRGKGLLEIDHIAFSDTSGGSLPFIQTTETTVKIHDNSFLGSKLHATCDQDAIVLGGTDHEPGGVNTGPTSAFQGYGSEVYGNFFSQIRHAVLAQTFANNVYIAHNTVDARCGSNLTIGAPIILDGTNDGGDLLSAHLMGAVVVDNLLEIDKGYTHAIYLRNLAKRNYIAGNGFWDPVPADRGGRYVYDIACDSTCTENTLIWGYSETYGIDPTWTAYGNLAIGPVGLSRPIFGDGGTMRSQDVNVPTLQLDTQPGHNNHIQTWANGGAVKAQLDQYGDFFGLAFIATQGLYPSGDGGPALRGGTGAPGAGLGNNGDLYLRQDGTTGAAIYQRRSGTWVAIL